MTNSKLKAMLKANLNNMSKKQKKEFFDELINAKLLLPITIKSNFQDNQQKDISDIDLNEPVDITPLIGKLDNRSFIPLYTDMDSSKKIGNTNFMQVDCEEVAAMIIQTKDIDTVVLNPGEEFSMELSIDSFINFVTKRKFGEIMTFLEDNAQVLNQDSRFYLRENVPLMKDLAEDGIFSSDLPFLVNFIDKSTEFKYLNIIIVPKGVKFIFLGKNGNSFGDSLFLPTIKFKLISEEDNVLTWKFVSQNLQNNKKFNLKYILLALLAIVLVIFILTMVLY